MVGSSDSEYPEQAKLLLEIDDTTSSGTFKQRSIGFKADRLNDINIKRIVNVGSIWYGIEDKGDHDEIVPIEDMNSTSSSDNVFDGLNAFLRDNGRRIVSVVENKFRGNSFSDDDFSE